jgi:predicted  nucleic acid-binding Zn-ribbon protein
MPHQCVRCSTFYPDAAQEILKGCSCGGKLFFYMKQERLDAIKKEEETLQQLTHEQKFQMEQDVYSMLGLQRTDPVVLDFESVRMLAPGKYELDIARLFRDEPMIFKLAEGKYMIDVPSVMRKSRKK